MLSVVGIGSHARGDTGLESYLDIFVGPKALS
jgi:predicted nucleotidyltransferase